MTSLLCASLLLLSRVELHVHLDGAVDSSLLLEIAVLRNLSLPGVGVPTSTREIDKVVKSASAFARFDIVNNILGGDVRALQRVGEWFAARQASLNASYTEVRYDPRRAAASSYDNSSLSLADAIGAFSEGLRRGAAAHRIEVYSLLCAMRGEPADRCVEIADAAASAQRPWKGVRPPPLGAVVGIDLAGNEWSYNNSEYIGCFEHARGLGLNTTIHAGEAANPEDIVSAVLEMRVDRIGHGYVAARNASLLALVKSHGVHLEACPGTALAEGSLSAIGAFLKHNMSFGLNEDDPSPYFGGCGFPCIEAIANDCKGNFSGSLEARVLCDAAITSRLHFGPADVKAAYKAARRAAFAPGAGAW
jgi:adenosine deaminase